MEDYNTESPLKAIPIDSENPSPIKNSNVEKVILSHKVINDVNMDVKS